MDRFEKLILKAACFLILITGYLPTPVSADAECPCVAPISLFPHLQNFESESLCTLDGLGCSQSCTLSPNWQNRTDDDIDWTIDRGGTPTQGTGPIVDATLGNGNGKYAYLESSCPDIGHSDKEGKLFSKCFNFSSIISPELSFAYHMYGEETGDLFVDVSTNSCVNWTTVASISGQQQTSESEAWRTKTVNLIQYSGLSNVRLRIRGVTGKDQFSDIAIDNIEVREASCCDLGIKQISAPNNACALGSAVPVTIQIENMGYNTQADFPVSFQVNGNPPINEIVHSALAGGSSMNYTFTAKANLSTPGEHLILAGVNLGGDTFATNNSLQKSVTHVPTISTFPYSQNFEAGKGGWIASGVNSTWEFGTPAKTVIQGAASGSNAWVTGGLGTTKYRNSEDSNVLGPCFDFSSLTLPVISLNTWWNSEGGWDGAVLQSSINNGASWQRVGNVSTSGNWYNNAGIVGNPGGQPSGWSGSIFDDSQASSGNWVNSSNSLSSVAGNTSVRLRVAFGSDPNVRDDGFAFDNIVISEGINALKTDSLIVDNNSNGKADVGDRIRYTINLTVGANVTGLILTDNPDPSTSLVVGSVTTNRGSVTQGNTAGNTFVRVNLGTMSGGATAQVNFNVNVNSPAPGAGIQICNQASLLGNGFSNLLSDDPSVSGSFDKTCTPAYSDSDGDGVPDPVDICPGFPDNQDSDGDGTPNGCDGCPTDPNKNVPQSCGCGAPETDTDGDGAANCVDGCPSNPGKTAPGVCGCSIPDTDTDGDGTPNCTDGCPSNPLKIVPGVCGCNTPDTDSDGDGTPNCNDGCPNDANKLVPGVCGCGVANTDTDGDGTPNCNDGCPNDSAKITGGACGCGVADTDGDGDGAPNCVDGCPSDPNKTSSGVCGCGVAETDTDGDGSKNCVDGCINDPSKTTPGQCGCGVPETDSDGDTIPDCIDGCPAGANTDSDGDGVLNCVDGCPNDPLKTNPGACGCGTPNTDSDGDGTPNCIDGCPSDPAKNSTGACGCGTPDTDADGDGTANCNDQCINDPAKIIPGACGCGIADTDSDSDGTPNCNDQCPSNNIKTAPGVCGCAVADTDTDADGTPNCNDACPNNNIKINPGICGCAVADTDSDNDGTPNCHDGCPNHSGKTSPGVCGCAVADIDSDSDGTFNCNDSCPNDPSKIIPGGCGCGVPDIDPDNDGILNCIDNCPNDPQKGNPGICGCGIPDTDSDDDGTPDNCGDQCPADPLKVLPLACGCGLLETDSDQDGIPDCEDLCPLDAGKIEPGQCGCGTLDLDSDGDSTPNCRDECPADSSKLAPGICGCNIADEDSDGDTVVNCQDACANDSSKTVPGICGCGTAEIDSDSDGAANCVDQCPNDSKKTEAGACGCGLTDSDSDKDGVFDCSDQCPADPAKSAPGICGCGSADSDLNSNSIPDCQVQQDFTEQLRALSKKINKVSQKSTSKVQVQLRAEIKKLLTFLQAYAAGNISQIQLKNNIMPLNKRLSILQKSINKLLKNAAEPDIFKLRKKTAKKNLKTFIGII